MRQGHRIIDPGAPDGEVGIVQLGVDVALPDVQLVEVVPLEIAANVDPRCQLGRGLGGQAEAMLVAAVVELDVQTFQFQRRRAAQFILPDDTGIADDDAILCQQPVGDVVFVARLGSDFQAGGKKAALAVAAQLQCRRVQLQPRQAQLKMPQRAPGQFGFDLIETQCRLPLGVANLEAFEIQRRAQSGPMRLDLANADRPIDARADQLLDLAPVAFDLRQDRVAQRQQQQGEGKVAQCYRPEQHAQQNAEPGVGSWHLAQTGNKLGNNGLGGS